MFAPVSAAVCRRQPKQVSSTLSRISYSVILFFLLGERAAVCIWIWTRTVTQLSGERRGRNIQANNRSRQMHNLFFFPFCFSKAGVKAHCPTLTVTHHHFTTKDCIAFINLPQLTVIWSKCDLRLLVLIVVTLGMRWERSGCSRMCNEFIAPWRNIALL